MTIPLVLRDLTSTALTKQVVPVTVEQIADMLAPFGCGDMTQIRKALRQLEAQGLAVRQHGKPWASPDTWRAA